MSFLEQICVEESRELLLTAVTNGKWNEHNIRSELSVMLGCDFIPFDTNEILNCKGFQSIENKRLLN